MNMGLCVLQPKLEEMIEFDGRHLMFTVLISEASKLSYPVQIDTLSPE